MTSVSWVVLHSLLRALCFPYCSGSICVLNVGMCVQRVLQQSLQNALVVLSKFFYRGLNVGRKPAWKYWKVFMTDPEVVSFFLSCNGNNNTQIYAVLVLYFYLNVSFLWKGISTEVFDYYITTIVRAVRCLFTSILPVFCNERFYYIVVKYR